MLEGRGGPNAGNRPSLTKDLGLALGNLGPELRATLGVALADFQAGLSELGRRLDTPQGARVVALSVRPLLERLAEPAAVHAAWRDAVSTFRDDQNAESCELRILQLAELCEHRGQDWKSRADSAEYILSDDAHVLARLGEVQPAPAASERELAGVPEERRIQLCAETFARPPSSSGVAVWLVIDGAVLEDGWLKVGPVQLFDHRYWPASFKPGGPMDTARDGFEAPPELADWEQASMWFDHLPEGGHRVLARVWLSNAALPQARQRARDVLQAMIDLAKTDSAWVLLDGAVTYREGGGWSGSLFADPAQLETNRRAVHPAFEGTATALTDFDDAFVERMLAGDRIATEAVEDAQWTVSVERAPSAPQRIVLATRALERTLSRARARREDTWYQPARRFLEAPWVEYTLLRELTDAGHTAAAFIPGRWEEPNSTLFIEVHDAVWPEQAPGRRRFNAHGLAEQAPRVLAVLPEGSMQHRLVRNAAAVLTSPEAALTQVGALRSRFERLLDRTERSRNALVHGTGTVQAVLASVDHFVTVLARYVAQEAMRQAETGKEPLIELEHARIRLLDQEARLQSGEAPVNVFF